MSSHLKNRIKALQLKRKHHQKIISSLIDDAQEISNPRQLITQFTKTRTNQVQPHLISTPRQSVVSHASDIQKQVNFQASMNIQSHQILSDQRIDCEINQSYLYISLLQNYGKNIQVITDLNKQQDLQIQGQGNFADLVSYIQENELWQILIKITEFTQDKQQKNTQNDNIVDKKIQSSFSGSLKNCRFQIINFIKGKSLLVNISNKPVDELEKQLIICKQDSIDSINISLLLLYRAVQGCKRQMSKMLNRLFGFPIQCFSLQKNNTMQLLRLIQKLSTQSKNDGESNCEENKKIIFGYNRNLGKQEELYFDSKSLKFNSIQASKLAHFYSKITICFKEFDLFCQNISIKHHINHYVVIDLTILKGNQGKQYFSIFNSHQQSKSPCQNDKVSSYKICILNSQKKIVFYNQIKQNLCCQTFLTEGEYLIYVSSCQLQKQPEFTLSVQSTVPCQLQIRFLPEYNTFTQTIIWSYLSQVSQSITLSQNIPQILRCRLEVLGFCVDIINIVDQKLNPGQLSIQYQDFGALCDQNYRKKTLKVKKDKSSNSYFIFLNRFSQINSISTPEKLRVRILYL